tara:strand:- start:1669 stop:2433 length:765 start_codon:yes stop_codon:yes gene_type:complete
MTVDELYEAFMNIGDWGEGGKFGEKSFGEDIFDFLGLDIALEGKGWTAKDWAKEYGIYIPSFDPAGIHLAEREREIDFNKAFDTLALTKETTDRVYKTELDTLSTELGREMKKGEVITGDIGLRSGSLESALEDTMTRASTKTKDLGDRLQISEKESLDKYNIAMVDTALDFEKTDRQEKEAWYDKVMAQIMRLSDQGAFTDVFDAESPPVDAYGRDCEGCAVVSLYSSGEGGTVETCRKGGLPCHEDCCGGEG